MKDPDERNEALVFVLALVCGVALLCALLL